MFGDNVSIQFFPEEYVIRHLDNDNYTSIDFDTDLQPYGAHKFYVGTIPSSATVDSYEVREGVPILHVKSLDFYRGMVINLNCSPELTGKWRVRDIDGYDVVLWRKASVTLSDCGITVPSDNTISVPSMGFDSYSYHSNHSNYMKVLADGITFIPLWNFNYSNSYRTRDNQVWYITKGLDLFGWKYGCGIVGTEGITIAAALTNDRKVYSSSSTRTRTSSSTRTRTSYVYTYDYDTNTQKGLMIEIPHYTIGAKTILRRTKTVLNYSEYVELWYPLPMSPQIGLEMIENSETQLMEDGETILVNANANIVVLNDEFWTSDRLNKQWN